MKQPELGASIARLREQQEMTQEQLAEACQINVRSVQRIESGDTMPRSSTTRKMSAIFGTRVAGSASAENTKWLLLMHLSSVLPVVIFALIIWFWKRDEDSRIDYQGIDVINFQISLCLYLGIASILVLVLIGLLLLPMLGIAICVVTIINTIKVAQGQPYHYPLSLNFVSNER